MDGGLATNYMKKIPALYYEFYETGAATRLGYSSAYDLAEGYPTFFYNFVFSHVEQALDYLNDTDNGKKWTSHLYSNVFSQENSAILNSGDITLLSEIPDILDGHNIEEGLGIVLKNW